MSNSLTLTKLPSRVFTIITSSPICSPENLLASSIFLVSATKTKSSLTLT
ncbi:MAG: hypothetical protein ACLVIU_07825 [Paraclostridium sp.]